MTIRKKVIVFGRSPKTKDNMDELDFNGFSRVEVMKIIDCLNVFSEACESRGVKFSKYSEEELYKILRMYRAWRLSGEPPF